jgi:anti-sigma B factor antagonist
MDLNLTTRTVGDRTVVVVAGEIDLESADQLRNYALEAAREHGGTVVLDLGRVTFLDSTGLKALIAIQRGCRADGCEVALAAANRPVTKVLDITGLADAFPTYDSVEAATGERESATASD